jgi:hypothetical protein
MEPVHSGNGRAQLGLDGSHPGNDGLQPGYGGFIPGYGGVKPGVFSYLTFLREAPLRAYAVQSALAPVASVIRKWRWEHHPRARGVAN